MTDPVRRRAGHAHRREHRHQQGRRAAVAPQLDLPAAPGRRTRRSGRARSSRRSPRTTTSTSSAAARDADHQRRRWSRSRARARHAAPGGCAHDLCALGDKLDASCNSCVHAHLRTPIRTAATAATSRTTRSSRRGTRSASPRSRSTARASKCRRRCRAARRVARRRSRPRSRAAGGRALHDQARVQTTRAADKTIRLLWASTSQAKQAIPQFALYPKDAAAGRRRRRPQRRSPSRPRSQNGVVKPDLDTAVAVRHRWPTFAGAARSARSALPLVDVLAAPVDAASGKPLAADDRAPALTARRCSSAARGRSRQRRRRHHAAAGCTSPSRAAPAT